MKSTNKNKHPSSSPASQDLGSWLAGLPGQWLDGFLASIKTFKRLALVILITICCMYLLVCALAYRSQDILIFFPPRTDQHPLTYPNFELQPLEVAFAGGTCKAWLYKKPSSDRIVIYGNGNATAMGTNGEKIHWLTRHSQCSLFFFDYPGYGLSSGKPGQKTIMQLVALWDQKLTTMGWPADRRLLYGHSLGGGVMAQWLKTYQGAGLVLESSFTSVKDMAARNYPFLPISLLLRHPFRTDLILKDIIVPVLIAHSPQDSVIPYAMALENSKHCGPHLRAFVEMHGGHNEAWLESQEILLAKLREVFPDWFASAAP